MTTASQRMSAEEYRKQPQTTEKVWQAQVVKLAKMLGYRVYHTQFSIRSTPGFPDLVMCSARQGRVIYAELKRENGKLTPEQEVWLSDLQSAGQEAYCWKPSQYDEVVRILKEVEK
jgi:hypothetical protein